MGSLIGLVKPLLPQMLCAVAMGVLGYLCAIFLTILAGAGILNLLGISAAAGLGTLFAVMAAFALLRGILHYGEQACNHYIAFRLLALIRSKVFDALRKLCPAKLEGRDRGNLISVITSDIELLEVFYAHTISPIAIAALTSLIMTAFMAWFHPAAGAVALAGYLVVGVALPLWNARTGKASGMEYREEFGDLNSFVLDSLRGLSESIQYGQEGKRKEQIKERSLSLDSKQKRLKELEGGSQAVTGACITFFGFAMLFLTVMLNRRGSMGIDGVVLCTVGMISSFGPAAALSSLSNNLNQTLACGERVLTILEEIPQVEDVTGKQEVSFEGAGFEQVTFAYDGETILKDFSMELLKNRILGIHGKSGSGKSTLLKLLMRFWDVKTGEVSISGRDIRQINTDNLRRMESFVTQETVLFHDSIANNIGIAREGATREEIMEAAKKASIHELVQSLPQGYDTNVGELGDSLSGGERQRIGIARAFLHDAPLMLLDEPTSSLDSLNEGIILKSLKEEQKGRTVVLVSHRESTMNIADTVFEMDRTRVS